MIICLILFKFLLLLLSCSCCCLEQQQLIEYCPFSQTQKEKKLSSLEHYLPTKSNDYGSSCFLKIKQELSNELKRSVKGALKRSKRSLPISNFINPAMNVLGDTLADKLSQKNSADDSSNDQQQSDKQTLKGKFETNQQKIAEVFTADNEKDGSEDLRNQFNDIEISSDVSFNGFDEFKFGDLRVSLLDDEEHDVTGTTSEIEFPYGVGQYIALECYREMASASECRELFKESSSKLKHKSCSKSIISSAFVIGNGFLISKDSIDKTRRKSLITRLCNRPTRYGNELVPDGMSISEIYNSEAHSLFFTDVNQYLTYLSSNLGVSVTNEELLSFATSLSGSLPILGSFGFTQEFMNKNKFLNSMNNDQNERTKAEKQFLLSIFEINVIRYSLTIDNLKSELIDPFFMIDFMSLPEDYFQSDSYKQYEKFIFRYGTHYIHSAEFGGQILFQTSKQMTSESNLKEAVEKSWQEIQSSFGSSTSAYGDVSIPINYLTADFGGSFQHILTDDNASRNRKENLARSSGFQTRNWTSVFLQSQGGDVNVAKLITRLESSTGQALNEWLHSIPNYPKAFNVKMRPLNELLDFNVRNLFVGYANSVIMNNNNNNKNQSQTCRKTQTRKCQHGFTVDEFQEKFDKRRKSLGFAIEMFRKRNDYQFSDLEIEAGSPETCLFTINSKTNIFPKYSEILNGTDIKITMEIDDDYKPFYRGEEIYVKYQNSLWFSRSPDENFNFLLTFKMPENNFQMDSFMPIVIRNLVFNYNETTGDLVFIELGKDLNNHPSVLLNKERLNADNPLMNEYWSETGLLKGMRVAQVSYVNVLQGIKNALNVRFFIMPCNLDWSSANSRKFSITATTSGKCIRFMASSLGDIFIVFSTNPHDEYTWYFVQLSHYGVALYKAGLVVNYKLDSNAGSLKDSDLFRRFFICFNFEIYKQKTAFKSTTGLYIQYGIVQGHESRDTVHLSYFDKSPLEPRYYSFGSYDEKVFIYDISADELTGDKEVEFRCSSEELYARNKQRCDLLCHKNCLGCTKSNSELDCNKCKYLAATNDEDDDAAFVSDVQKQTTCLDVCPLGFEKDALNENCVDIDECARNETVFIYKTKAKTHLYEWKKCAANNSVCLNTIGSYACKCKPGYYGDGIVCLDIDECKQQQQQQQDSNNCPKNSKCENLPGSYKCYCLSGFSVVERRNDSASSSSECQDINECERDDLNECQLNSYCKNLIGSYKCICKRGFRGDGVTCQDIDECDERTAKCSNDVNAVCLNTIGSYECSCKAGFVRSNDSRRGKWCSPAATINIRSSSLAAVAFQQPPTEHRKIAKTCNTIKTTMVTMVPCAFKHNCDRNASCVYDPVRLTFKCECNKSFIGNGFKCYSKRKYFRRNDQICRLTPHRTKIVCVKFTFNSI